MAKHPESIWLTSVATLQLKPTGGAVKFGPVYLWKKTIFRQAVHKYWCELHRESNFYPRQLVLHEISQHIKVRHCGKVSEMIPLDDVFSVMVSSEQKGKHGFKIVTGTKQYLIEVHTSQEASAWVDTINNEVFGPPVPGVVYEFRVMIGSTIKRRSNRYLLKVCDKTIKVFTANGKIETRFSLNILDIHKIQYQPKTKSTTKQGTLTLSVLNAQSGYQEKNVLALQAKSTMDLVRVLSNRLTAEKLQKRASMIRRSKSVDSTLHTQSRFDFLVGNKTLETDLAENGVSQRDYIKLPTSASKSIIGKKTSLDLPSSSFFNHSDTHSRRKQWQNQRKFVPVLSEDQTSLYQLKEKFGPTIVASKSLDQIYSDEIHSPNDLSITNESTRCHIEKLSRFPPLSIPDEPLYDDPFYDCIDDTAHQKSSSLPDVSAGSKCSSESVIGPPNTQKVKKNIHPLLVQYKADSLPANIKEAHYDQKMIASKSSSLPPITCRIGSISSENAYVIDSLMETYLEVVPDNDHYEVIDDDVCDDDSDYEYIPSDSDT
ncbi:uncharacterized protein [Dysidea avara]|uniref:uncharacterized protein isoform X2 n=1 Tax=Dysidea avara TaxID=196820 RepID=UPI003317B895